VAPNLRSAAAAAALLAALVCGCAPPQTGPVVLAGNARFEFLTPGLLRLEYSPSGTFVDAATAVVMQRDWQKVAVQSRRRNGWLVASSSVITVRYRLQSGPFTAGNLEVSWRDASGARRSWHPGERDALNLGGLPYSLDNVSAENLPAGRSDRETPVNDLIPGIDVLLGQAKPGLLSRAGYAFIDDSGTPVWNARRTWVEPRAEPKGQDWYLFAYRDDYRAVLGEYARLCGGIPMVPRYVLGPMITDLNFEYFPDSAEARAPQLQHYNQQHLEDEVTRLRGDHIPFDTLVLDFAWHNYGWEGGYDFSPLIPHPEEFSSWLHRQGIKLSLNDHPGYANTEESILSFQDSHAPEVLRALGRTPPPRTSFDMALASWSFAPDPQGRGLEEHWYEASAPEPHWKAIQTGSAWQRQGYPRYDGVGWYRATVQLPAALPAKLYVYLGEVRGDYRLFVNGREVPHSSVHWPRRLTYANITGAVLPGGANQIVLRVEPAGEYPEMGSGLLLGPYAIRDVEPPSRIYFDLSNQQQAGIFMRDLHGPLMRMGVDFWWVDGGSGAVDMPGLNKQLWTNKVFYDYTQEASGRRAFILGRYGDWGSERYPGFFTGDTYSQWPVLAYEVAFTARGGNVLVPYISHDIGGFHGDKIDFELYARWLEFGAFSPLLRMHSAHENPRDGNARMPWTYGEAGVALMRKYFALRTQLLPYLYTYSWIAHRESLPLLRPLYLEYPHLEEAYRHSHEYFFGAEMLVAPVVDAAAERSIYLPPGDWVDFFTATRYSGSQSVTARYAVDEIPVFVRDGAVIPEQPAMEYSDQHPADPLIVNVYGSGAGRFDLYEDDGISFGYEKGAYAVTTLRHEADADGLQHLFIEPARGEFAGQLPARAYEVRIHSRTAPRAISFDGASLGPGAFDATQGVTVVTLPRRDIRQRIEVTWR